MQEAFTDSKVKPSSMAGSVIALIQGAFIFYQAVLYGKRGLK